MYVKKRRAIHHPRIFADVLQAILDLRDIRGSNIKTIIDQIQTHLGKNQICRSKNIAMQVQKALRHGINSGVLEHKAGKYKLTFGNNLTNATNDVDDKDRKKSPPQDQTCGRRKRRCDNKCIPPKPRRCRTPNRRRRYRRRRKPCPRHDLSNKSSETSGMQSDKKSRSTSQTPDEPGSEIKIQGRTKRKVYNASKFKKIDKPRSKSKKPSQHIKIERKLRKPNKDTQKRGSPEPVDPDTNRCSGEVNNQNDNKSNETKKENEKRDGDQDQEQQDDVPYNMDYEHDSDTRLQQCDNPECLCHLKHEQDDDDNCF
ncbi:histone H1, gonadal-like [Onthophagus taurus]|uniref:histone H1, gonadal-like n=1 Tax=Onthophagus taurus TaxID=166361 RepID=UPI000C205CAF|nr:uncharacterized protein LOC111415442 [Onthophagus taurus]